MDERTEFARHLRRNMTAEERVLWNALSRFRPRFTTQLRIDPYVADFACRRARVVVEVDGGQHVDNRNDRRRTEALSALGWRTIRFWNSDVRGNIDGVIEAISALVSGRTQLETAPHFIPFRSDRERRPRTRKKEPPPPANAEGES